jgi:sirohydrochlorin ferrochelatase
MFIVLSFWLSEGSLPETTVKTGLIVFAHGSRVESANREVRAVTNRMVQAGGFSLVETAFLDIASPTLDEAVGLLITKGAARVVVLPYFLTMGTHLRRDLPRIAAAASQANHGIEIRLAAPLDGHPALAEILVDRAREALG